MNDWISIDGKIVGAMIDGKECGFSDLSAMSGIKDTTLRSRARSGWSLEQALTMTPLKSRKVVVAPKGDDFAKQCSKVASMKWV